MRISLLLVLSFVLVTQAWAANSGPTPTAETQFLTTVIALQGQGLSQADFQTKASTALQTYDQTAPVDGREGRMTTALVAMRVMTPDSVATLQKTIDANTATALATTTDAQSAMSQVLQTTFTNANQGAQFSSCQSGLEWGAGFALGSAALFGTAFYLRNVDKNNLSDNQLLENGVGTIGSFIGGAALAVASVIMFATSGC